MEQWRSSLSNGVAGAVGSIWSEDSWMALVFLRATGYQSDVLLVLNLPLFLSDLFLTHISSRCRVPPPFLRLYKTTSLACHP